MKDIYDLSDLETHSLIQVCPILMQHKAYPLVKTKDPVLIVKIINKEIPVLLDTGAHCSVLPRSFLEKIINLPDVTYSQRPVRVFGGHEVNLDGPVHVTVTICGLKVVHPFYYVSADVPPIVGYDLMRRAQIVLDPHQGVAWSKHPNTVTTVDCHVTTDSHSATQPSVDHTQSSYAVGNDIPQVSATESTQVVYTPLGASSVSPAVVSPSATITDTTVPSSTHGSLHQLTRDIDNTNDLPDHINLLYHTTIEETHLSDSELRQFRDLLYRHANCFAKDNNDLGFCDILQHDIDTGDSPPIKQSPRRPPLSAGDAEEEIINDMLASGVIEPSTSPWASPVCLVKKPDGKYRFCIDYRRVNAVSRKDAFPVPDIQDALDSLKGTRYYCTLDLLSGYWQTGMTPRAKERSAFCTRRGLYQFRRMPFGLSGAPATFCRLMHRILGDYIGKICLCYIDDCLIFAESKTELLERLDLILSRLTQFNLKVKPTKCVLFRREIQFLGHLVNASGVQPLPDKVAAIEEWPTPRCLREVRAFLGLIGYYRKFIHGFAKLAEPLTRLTRKGTRFCWLEEADDAFQRLKRAMLGVPILAFPYPNIPCILDTDCSEVSYGSALSQVIDGVETPIAFFSRVMSQSQMNYCATKRELLAVIASLQHFRHYLLGVQVILRTDHHSLKWLHTFKKPEGLMARWIETLSEFQITIEHRPGRAHSNADALSRQNCKQCWGKKEKPNPVDELARADECAVPLGLHALQLLSELSNDEVQNLQADDPTLSVICDWFTAHFDPTIDDLRKLHPEGRKLWSMRNELKLVDSILVRQTSSGTTLVVPLALRRRLFEHAHASPLAAHLGPERTLFQLRQNYYWPGMTKDVKAWYSVCDICNRSRGPPARAHAPMTKIIASAPLDLVAIDILSGLPVASDGSNCILVVTDYMTKWAEAYPLENEEAHTCMTALYTGFFSRFGLPTQIHSDQGRNFESRLVQELTKLAGIRRTRTTPFHPRGDGQTERMNRTILQMLRATAYDCPQDWPAKLPFIMGAYRMTPHSSTGVTPNLAMLGREVKCPCALIAAPPEEEQTNLGPYTATFRDTIRQAHERVRGSTNRTAKTQKTYFDARAKAITFSQGQLVWLFWPRPLIRQQKRKLTRLWVGPYRIKEFKSEIVAEIEHIKTGKKQTVHVDRLIPCHSVPEVISPCSDSVRSSPVVEPPAPTPSSLEHQSSTTNTSIGQSPTITRRTGRCIRRPARYR